MVKIHLEPATRSRCAASKICIRRNDVAFFLSDGSQAEGVARASMPTHGVLMLAIDPCDHENTKIDAPSLVDNSVAKGCRHVETAEDITLTETL